MARKVLAVLALVISVFALSAGPASACVIHPPRHHQVITTFTPPFTPPQHTPRAWTGQPVLHRVPVCWGP